jgi:hypothetical protein
VFREYASFYGEESSALRPTFKLEDHPLSVVNILAATLHIGGRPFMILTVSKDLFRKRHCYRLIFVTEMDRVLSEVRTEFYMVST